MLEIAMDGIRKAAEDFYTLTKTKIVLYDENRKILYSYPPYMCPFCTTVRQSPQMTEKCLNCDNIGFDGCQKEGKAYIYNCHMGLSEAIAPIYENGVIIGYLMLGQLLNTADYERARALASIAADEHGMPALKEEFGSIKVVDDKFIQAAVNMMSMCASYLYVSKIVRKQADVLAYQLADYIERHLGEELSVPHICKQFFVSKSKLYEVSMNAFHMGISEYIRKLRMSKAREMLTDTKKSVTQIAHEVGYEDVNFFIRTFKQHEGVTPGKIRKDRRE